MKWIKRIVTWVLVLGVLGGLAWAGMTLLSNQRAASEDSSSFTDVVTVERGSLTASVSPTGEVYAPRQVQLTCDVTRIPLLELNVAAGQEVKTGDVLARIDPASLERAVRQAQANLLSAEDALEQAQDPYTDLDRQQAELAVAQAQTALEAAQQDLADLQDPELEAAQTAVEDAIQQLKQAQDDLASLQEDEAILEEIDRLQWEANEAEAAHGELLAKNGSGEVYQDRLRLAYNRMLDAQEALETAKLQAALNLLHAETQVVEAQEALADAKASLADLQAGPTALELAQARNQVAQAAYNLTKAEDDLATIVAGPDANEIQVAQASYNAVLAALEEAQATLEAATMLAPFDGTVVSVGAEVGDLVSSGTVVVSLADLTQLRVRASVDETDISQVEVGQPVQITFDAFPGRQFQGQVLEVPLEGELSQNIVIYQVLISLEGTEAVALKSGMTANLQIIVGQRENALLVPLLAVQQGDTGDVVLVQDVPGESAVQAPVELGLNDGTYVEVLRGLNEGDQVVVQYDTSEQTTGFGFGRFGAGMGEGPVIIKGDFPDGGPPQP
jgi:HlyD family secretion protein